MTRPRPLVPRGDPADTVRVVGEFGVIARVLARAGSRRGSPRSVPATTRPCCGLPTGGWWRRPTSWSRAGTSGATGPRRRTSGTRRPRPAWPTSRRWAGWPRRCWSASPARRTRRRPGWRAWPAGWPRSAGRWARPSSAATRCPRRRTARPSSLSVTALGDLGRRLPVLRSGARPGDVVALAGRLGWSAARARRAAAGLRQPARGRGRAPAAHAAVRGRPGRRRCGRARDVRRQRRAAGRRRAHRRREPRRPGPGPCGAAAGVPRAGRPAPAGRVGPRGGPDGLGAHRGRGPRAARDVPAHGGAPGGMDADRRGAHRPHAPASG